MTFTIQSAKTAVLALTVGFGAILQSKTAEARDIENGCCWRVFLVRRK